MLDESQRRFVDFDGPRVRLLAPAGSGKTLSLLHRSARIAAATGERFLLLTFTRAARNEILARLKRDEAFTGAAPLIQVTTLNSWGWRQLRAAFVNPKLLASDYDRRIAFENVLMPTWSKYERVAAPLRDARRRNKARKAIFEAMETLKTLGFRHDRYNEAEAQRQVDFLVECGMELPLAKVMDELADLEIVDHDKPFVEALRDEFFPFWVEACEQLRLSSLVTMEDQKYWAYLTLDNLLESGRRITGAAQTHHLVVDEFQDINPLDLRLIVTIAALNNSTVTIAGDDDQAIYEWRGASPEFILEADKHLGGAFETFVLEANYRSPRNVVLLSQTLISRNHRRVAKRVHPVQTFEAEVQVRRHRSVAECIYDTTDLVKSLLERDDIKSVALVSRKRSQIIPYQVTFAGAGVPFYAAEDLNISLSDAFDSLKRTLAIRGRQGTVSPWGPGPVDDLLALCNDVKRYPLSKSDRASLSAHLAKVAPTSFEEGVRGLRSYRGPLKGDNADGRMSESFATAIEALVGAKSVASALRAISDEFAGLQADYGKSAEDIYFTDPPFFYLAALAERYEDDYAGFYRDIEAAMAQLARVSDDDEPDDVQVDSRLHLMTALRAKGREFDAVIVLDANNGIWPSRWATTPNELEQERRLFYVATTRPRKFLAYVCSDRLLDEELQLSPYLAEMGLI